MTSEATWVQPLLPGPLDLIGDVHGEIEALERLLVRLGVEGNTHTQQRRLVFVGDLVDRGPDSPAVVRRVRGLVEAGVAQVVVGNHEVNLLSGAEKEGNGWWFGQDDAAHVETPSGEQRFPFPSVSIDPAERASMEAWLATLPVALEREDLRVVHACWHGASVDALRNRDGSLGAAMLEYDGRVHDALRARGVLATAKAEEAEFAMLKVKSCRPTRELPAVAEMTEAEQNDNPLRRLTSGEEVAIPLGEYEMIGGRYRVTKRARWWERYADEAAVVVGHFWRSTSDAVNAHSPVWAGVPAYAALGPRRNVFCIDYSVGRTYRQRWLEAKQVMAKPDDGPCRLAALRWPERTLLFDDSDDVTNVA